MASDTVIVGYNSPADEIDRVPGTPIHHVSIRGSAKTAHLYGGPIRVLVGTWGAGRAHATDSPLATQEDVTPASVDTATSDFAWLAEYLSRRYSTGFRIAVTERAREDDPSSLVRYIQDSAGLSVSEISRILRVSRRTIHNWLEGGGIASGNHERLVELLDAIQPMADSWGPHRTNVWIQTSGVATGSDEVVNSLGEAVDDALRADEIPVLLAAPVEVDEEIQDIAPVTQTELFAALAAFTRPRVVEDRHDWTPREVAWSAPETDDD